MGKTLLGILEVAAVIAVQAIPGVGQAVGVALGVSAAVGTAIATAAVIAGETLLNSVLAKSPKPATTETAIKSPIPPRVSGYGELRLHGAYIFFETNDDGKAIDVYAFHDGRIASVIQHYLGDRRVTVSGGWVQEADDKAFGGGDVIQVGTRLGLATETAFSEVIAAIPDHWTTAHRGDGVVTGFMISRPVKSKNFSKVYPTGGPNQTPMSIAIHAQLVFDWRDGTQSVTDPTTWKWSENAVLHLAHYLLVRMGKDWSAHFVPTLAYWTAAASDADIAMPLKGVQTIMAAKADSGDTHVNLYSTNGLAVGMVISIFVSGDNSKTETKTVTSISGLTVSFSGGLGHKHPMGSQVTWASTTGAPATEPRYRSCVAHQHTDAHKDVLAHLLACFDGWLSPRADGALVVYSGRYVAPTIDPLGPDEIVSYSYQEGIDEEAAINTLKVSYVSANHDYSTVDTDDWTDEDDIATRGKVLSDSLENQVPSFAQARRLGKRALAKIMAPTRGTVTTTASGRRLLGQRYFPLQLIEASTTFFDGVAEVQKLTRNLATGGVTVDWIAADPTIDEWNPATEEGNPAPVGNRVAAEPLVPPTITAAAPNFGTDSATGTAGVFIDLTVEGPDRDDLVWYARTRQAGAAIWGERTYTDIDAGASIELATEYVPADASVEVEVAYGVGDGRVSDWSATATVNTSSASIPPARVTGLSASGGVGSATVHWNNPTSANLAVERLYHSTGTTFGSATQVGSDIAGAAGTAQTQTPSESAGTIYYWVTTVSSGGAESTPVGPVSATIT